MRLRNFGVTGGALRKGSLDPYAKGQETFTQTAAGEPERGYRRIGYLIEKAKLRFEQIQADGRGDGFGT